MIFVNGVLLKVALMNACPLLLVAHGPWMQWWKRFTNKTFGWTPRAKTWSSMLGIISYRQPPSLQFWITAWGKTFPGDSKASHALPCDQNNCLAGGHLFLCLQPLVGILCIRRRLCRKSCKHKSGCQPSPDMFEGCWKIPAVLPQNVEWWSFTKEAIQRKGQKGKVTT